MDIWVERSENYGGSQRLNLVVIPIGTGAILLNQQTSNLDKTYQKSSLKFSLLGSVFLQLWSTKYIHEVKQVYNKLQVLFA